MCPPIVADSPRLRAARPPASVASRATLRRAWRPALVLVALCVAGPAEAGGWDVNAAFGPTKQVPVDVREGTWMSVSVHPDGKRVAFDLLGDLYEVPLTGGEAKPLTRGAAWDMQPTYSPDGRWLAFTSDRGGGDNIWILPTDTPVEQSDKRARAVTRERFRLLNSPAWSGDSRFVVARKHFTSRRSLGAGELWLYHRTGGKGVQMTKRPNDQKDVGEPALSPDGRWLYYSRDKTPGKVFQYNKDPNPGIFAIFRLDRHSGRTERFLGGPGGAIRPTPSPDGKRLAYIRRVRGKTVLFARTLASGEEVRLADDLDRDLQETWSVHGVYPALSWTPQSRSLVVWAGGKLWELGLTGARRPIPFHVKTTRRVHRALRRPVAVAPKDVQVRAVRWPRVSPDGARVVFEALGRLWLRGVADTGAPRPLTGDTRARELTPAWSRDGKHIAYASWDDRDLGAIRVTRGQGGRPGRAVTRARGHYRAPTWSPDGRALVYEKLRGGWLRPATWSNDPGLYVVAARGGPARRLTRTGHDPHFGATPDRVYFHARNAKAKRHELRSVGLSDLRERVHATSKLGTELWLSPNGQWLAFREGYEAWVTPFVAAGRPQHVGPGAKGVPRVRASSGGGSFLSWAADSRSLTWVTGPTLAELKLDDAFTWLRAGATQPKAAAQTPALAAGSAPKAKPKGPPVAPVGRRVDLGFRQPASRPAHTLAIVGARVLTMAPGAAHGGLIPDGTVVWRADRIVAVGPRASTAVPKGATVLQGRGKTVIPGLIDVHAHAAQGTHGIIPQRNWSMHALLAFGVTTLHDPSNRTATVFAAHEQQRAGRILAPRIFSTGTILYGATAEITAKIQTKADALRHLRRLKAIGAFSVKSYNQPRREQRQMVLAAARELNMLVVPEGGALFMHNMTQVVDGHTGVEHALPVARCYADVVQLWSKTDVGHTPTLGVAYGGLGGENYWYAHTRVDAHPRLNRYVPPWAVDPKSRRPRTAPKGQWNHIAAARFAMQLVDAGGRVQLGAHGQREGLAAHWELWSFVQGGLTPVQALRAGTADAARYLGMDRDLGVIAPGKLADLAVIDGAPDQDIRSSERVAWTVLGGRVYDALTLTPVAPKGPKPGPFFWQQAGHPSHGPRHNRQHTCGCGVH